MAGFHHPLVRAARGLLRKKERIAQRRFLVEGPALVQAALQSGAALEVAFLFGDASAIIELSQRIAGLHKPVFTVDERTMRSLSDTQSPQGIVAAISFIDRPVQSLGSYLPAAGNPAVVLLLDDVGDPGNAGTLIRSAEAFNAHAVCFGPRTVEPYNNKVVRATMGSLFRVPLFCYSEWAELANAARAADLTIAALEKGAGDVRALTMPRRIGLLVGHERHGLTRLSGEDSDVRVGIANSATLESHKAA